jgi:pilus assembly protein CpaE
VVNVGWLLSNRYFKRAVIMDTDFFHGTANLLMDIRSENSYINSLESSDKIDDYFVSTFLRKYDQRLFYLDGLLGINDDIILNEEAFRSLINAIKEQFNYVLVDSQRHRSVANDISMSMADIFILMVEMSVASAQNTSRLLQFLYTKHASKKIVIIANKVGLSSNGALSQESFEKVIGRKIDCIMPHDDRITLASANIGQPLASLNCALTSSLESLTEDILGKTDYLRIEKNSRKGKSAILDKIRDIFRKK